MKKSDLTTKYIDFTFMEEYHAKIRDLLTTKINNLVPTMIEDYAAPKSHTHLGSQITSAVANATLAAKATNLVSTEIPYGADMNNYTTPGMYYCAKDNCTSVTNKPYLVAGYFSVLVEKHGGAKQTLTFWNTISEPITYVRNYDGTEWGSWSQVIWKSTVPKCLETTRSANIHTEWASSGVLTRYFGSGTFTNQPSTYGNLFSIANGDEKSQLWFSQATGSVFHRQGNSNGWNGTEATEDANGWVAFLDSSNWSNYVNINVLEKVYPVGSIYMSLNATSPASLFGGTWEQIQDRFLFAASATNVAGAEGGAASRSHSHTEGNLATAIGASADDVGRLSYQAGAVNSRGPTTCTSYTLKSLSSETVSRSFNHHTRVYGTTASATVSTMPPYYCVYMWRRTA